MKSACAESYWQSSIVLNRLSIEEQHAMIRVFIKVIGYLLVCIFIFHGVLLAQGERDSTIIVNEDIKLIRIKNSFYIHTSWFNFPGFGRYPSNGLIFIKNGKALLIDTPVSNDQTKRLHNFLKESMKLEITKVIVGHFHDDCLGGLEYLQKQGIPSISSELTKVKCKELGLPIPSLTFKNKMIIDFEGQQVICQYFGGGHTVDNIVVYFPKDHVLFGGCLIRSKNSKGLGNRKDAVIDQWGATIERIKSEYNDIDYIIPGHGHYGDKGLLRHTINLVEKHKIK